MADRLPPGQGALQSWNNFYTNRVIHQNLLMDGKSLQCTLNFPQGKESYILCNHLSNQRGLLTTTNAGGTITKGDKYAF
jgi:hypothetical protein